MFVSHGFQSINTSEFQIRDFRIKSLLELEMIEVMTLLLFLASTSEKFEMKQPSVDWKTASGFSFAHANG